jgi:hypothetical protein
MSSGISSNTSIEDLKKVFDELVSSLRSIISDASTRSAVTSNYNAILDEIIKILKRIGQDIESFVKLDIRTEVKKKDQTVIYETIVEVNGNITSTFPDPTQQDIWDKDIFDRHNSIADNAIQQRNKEICDIITNIINLLNKIP